MAKHHWPACSDSCDRLVAGGTLFLVGVRVPGGATLCCLAEWTCISKAELDELGRGNLLQSARSSHLHHPVGTLRSTWITNVCAC